MKAFSIIRIWASGIAYRLPIGYAVMLDGKQLYSTSSEKSVIDYCKRHFGIDVSDTSMNLVKEKPTGEVRFVIPDENDSVKQDEREEEAWNN